MRAQISAGQGGEGPIARALARLTPRETWMLGGLGLLALGTAAFYALQWSSGERDRVATAQSDLTLARQARADATQRREGAVSAADLDAAAGWSVRARNLWLARLKIEQALAAAAAAAHLPTPQIKIAEGLEDNSATPLLKAEVTGPYVAHSWIDFMRALASSGLVFVIEKLDVGDDASAEYSLTLLAPVSLDEPPPAPAAATP
jgi:hypothetical protein